MKEFLSLLIGAIGIVVTILLIPCSGEKLTNSSSIIKIDSTYYNGHTMLIWQKGTSVSVCHSPTCKKCYQIYD